MDDPVSPARIAFSTKTAGPFFELKGLPLKDAGAETIRDLLKEGEAKVEAQLQPGHGVRTGEYKSSVHQAFTRSSRYAIGWGKIAGGGGSKALAIRGNFLEGGSRRNTAGRFKGYAMFRKAAQHLRKLARQMAGKAYAKAVERLT